VGTVATGSINPWLKKLLWVVFLGITAFLLAYPVNLRSEDYLVWSPDIFPNLPLFGTLFSLWAALLLMLAFTPTSEGSAKWERLALVVVAALVFRGFWGIIAPIQGQAFAHVISDKIWQNLGQIAYHPSAAYIDWPGVSAITIGLSQFTGLELATTVAILTVFIVIVVGIGSYLFLLAVLQSSLAACLASFLIIAGNLTMVIYLTAGPCAMVFVVLPLAMLFQKESLATPPRILVTIILLMAAAITHFHSSMHLFFFTLGLWILAIIKKQQPGFQFHVTTVILFFIIPAVWLTYWGIGGLIFVSHGIQTFFADPLDFWGRMAGVFTLGEANLGEGVPLWYSLTRLSWLVLLYLLGGLVWLWSLFRLNRLEPVWSRLAAAFGGLVILSIISSLVSPRGFGELQRGLTYAAFFTVPFLFLFLHRLKPKVTKIALVSLSVVLVALSLTSFLSGNRAINQMVPYRSELATGEWLESRYGTGQGLNIFLTHPILPSITYYLYDASYVSDVEAESAGYTAESRWQAIDELLDSYDRLAQSGIPVFYIHSPKMALISSMTFGIPVDDPRWDEITQGLAESNNQVFDNGSIQIYSSGR